MYMYIYIYFTYTYTLSTDALKCFQPIDGDQSFYNY